jgi:UDP-4-amino-4,6-dideoxy-N-acetyl-beta-L-altrosamine transaminase
MIPYGRQDIDASDIEAVVTILSSEFLTQGPTVPAFEEAVSAYCGSSYAVAVNSATSALHLACLAVGVNPGDIVWTSPITFVASANCAVYCGAIIDFVDVDSNTGHLCVEKLLEKLESAKAVGKLPKVIIPVHLCGQSCDMDEIWRLSKLYGFKVIEDASHAIGGKYKERLIGNCQNSDITIFSFHPVKIITTGEGGMCLTNSYELAEKVRLLRSHGIVRDKDLLIKADEGPWYYEQHDLGYNYRMSDIQASLGKSQIKRIDEFVLSRREIAKRYDEALVGLPISTPWQYANSSSSFHLYPIRLHLEKLKKKRKEIFNFLRLRGIGVNVHYIPVHTQPYYARMGFKPNDFPASMKYYGETISLPIYPKLTLENQSYVVEVLAEVLAE